MRRTKGKGSELDYTKLLKYIDKNQPEQVSKWLHKHHKLPGFDLYKTCKYKNAKWRIFDFLKYKFQMGSVGDEMFEIVCNYIPKHTPDAKLLSHVAMTGQIDICNLLEIKLPRQEVQLSYFNTLCQAIIGNSNETAKKLITKVDKINAFYVISQRTPLMLAAQQGSIEIMKALLEYKADPFIRDNTDDNYDTLEIAVVFRQAEAVQALFDYLRVQAIKSESFEKKFANMLAQSKAPHLAAVDQTTDMLKLLIKNQMDINQHDANKLTPLMVAIRNMNYPMFSFIFDHPQSQRILSSEEIIMCVTLAKQNPNSLISAKLTYYVKILTNTKIYLENDLIIKCKDDQVIQLYCANVELNVARDEKRQSPLELFIIHRRYELIAWFLKTYKHKLKTFTILKSFLTALEYLDPKIIIFVRYESHFLAF